MAISDKLTTLNGIKSDIKAAIIAKGGTATDDFTTYATAISNLPSGGGGDDLKKLIDRTITSIDIPSGITKIGQNAFSNCTGLTSVTIPNTVTIIDTYAFQSCTGLTSITIPNSVTSIGNQCFYNCNKLTSVTIPDSVTTIGGYAFSGCSGLTSVTIGNSVTTIGNKAFGASGLTSVTIPDSVTTIGSEVFYRCTDLTSVTIGNSVTTIGNNCFYFCPLLASVTCTATTPPTIYSATFNGVPTTCPIYVPSESVETYKAANIWSDRADYIQAIQ